MKTSRMLFRYLSAVNESSKKMGPINLRWDVPIQFSEDAVVFHERNVGYLHFTFSLFGSL
jgi:hypothetical protein